MLLQEDILDHFPENEKLPEGTLKELWRGFILAWFVSLPLWYTMLSDTVAKIDQWPVHDFIDRKFDISLLYLILSIVLFIIAFAFIRWSNAKQQTKQRLIPMAIFFSFICSISLLFLITIKRDGDFTQFISRLFNEYIPISIISSFLFFNIIGVWFLFSGSKYRIWGVLFIVVSIILVQVVDL